MLNRPKMEIVLGRPSEAQSYCPRGKFTQLIRFKVQSLFRLILCFSFPIRDFCPSWQPVPYTYLQWLYCAGMLESMV